MPLQVSSTQYRNRAMAELLYAQDELQRLAHSTPFEFEPEIINLISQMLTQIINIVDWRKKDGVALTTLARRVSELLEKNHNGGN